MEILLEDNHLLVVNKPAGWIVQGATEDQFSLLEWARSYIKQKYQKPGNVFIGVVSRLDSRVTGAVPFARTSKAASRLSEQLRNNTMIKNYWAIVEGSPPQQEGRLEHWLTRRDSDVVTTASTTKSAQAQLGILEYRRLATTSLGELLEIKLITGRKHQIRAQMQAIGTPVVGDIRYGSKRRFAEGIALHCREIGFIHPTRDEQIRIEAEVPSYWP